MTFQASQSENGGNAAALRMVGEEEMLWILTVCGLLVKLSRIQFLREGRWSKKYDVHRSLWDNCADSQSEFYINQVETRLELINLFLTFQPKLWEQQKPKEPNHFHPNSTFCTYYSDKLGC